ncbi:hypothetical protein BaRGS_00022650 [Batillaria attramentaria]|uniref:Ig-like domain-containing protein n=1 Tax=Batillaria attramentaria TaxID=370345 RepID=A0ABD0KFT1_9CAEN
MFPTCHKSPRQPVRMVRPIPRSVGNMTAVRCVIVLVIVTVAAFPAVYSDTCPRVTEMLREQSRQLTAMSEKLTSLDNQVVDLTSQVSLLSSHCPYEKVKENQQTTRGPFEVLSTKLERVTDGDAQEVTYKVLLNYKAESLPDIMQAHSTVPLNHSAGRVEFLSTDILDTLYVWIQPRLLYDLTFITAGGPRDSDRYISNVVIATQPDRDLIYEEGRDSEVTLTTEVYGNRTTKLGKVSYYVFLVNETLPNTVDAYYYAIDFVYNYGDRNEEDTSDTWGHEYDDTASQNNASDDENHMNATVCEQYTEQCVLELIRHKREGNKTINTFRFDSSKQSRGFILLRSRVEFDCSGCVLYETSVAKVIPFYRQDMQFAFPHPGYVGFVRYPQYGHVIQCQTGQVCQIACEVLGENLHKDDFSMQIAKKGPTGGYVAMETDWHVNGFFAVGMSTMAAVTVEDGGKYVCTVPASQGFVEQEITLHVV